MTEFGAKVRTIGTLRHKGQKRRHVVLNEDTGRPAGQHIEHWDGRQDAIVSPETIHYGVGRRKDG